MRQYHLRASDHPDAPRLVRTFVRTLIAQIDAAPDAIALAVLLASDAATDAVRAGVAITVGGVLADDHCSFDFAGTEFTPPVVVTPPEGVSFEASDGQLRMMVNGRE